MHLSLLSCVLVICCVYVNSQICGSQAGGAVCTAPGSPCCSPYGYCGSTAEYCGAGCQSGCDGQIQVECSNVTTKAPSTSGNSGPGDSCTFRYTITGCDLVALMENQCNDCASYLPHIIQAMERYDLNCPVRIATFMAQVRHETAGLNTFYQPADNGAGAIHMIPGNYRVACTEIPEMEQAFTEAFPNCAETNKCLCGTDPEASVIVGRPELAFLTGGWWFKTGSEQMLGFKGCGDLRLNADDGRGTLQPPSGYYEVSRCIFGSLDDTGLSQRLAYFDAAWAVAQNFVEQQISPTTQNPQSPTSSNTPTMANSPSTSNSPTSASTPKANSGSVSDATTSGVALLLVTLYCAMA